MTIHISDLGVSRRTLRSLHLRLKKGENSSRERFVQKRILIRVYRGAWMNECSMMMLAGAGSAFG